MKNFNKIAKQSLEEARNRSNKKEKNKKNPKEINGPKGPEPTRYGDWEKKGITSDF